jgi:TetR/AcrR family transcriptional repressor of nem operon
MGRVSHAQAQANRQRVVERASQLFREQGTGVSVADLMKAAGLTHGGFYK